IQERVRDHQQSFISDHNWSIGLEATKAGLVMTVFEARAWNLAMCYIKFFPISDIFSRILSSELKRLYVAVTNISGFAMKMLSIACQSASLHTNWINKGKFFSAQRQYEQSGNEESYKLVNAYYIQQIARDSVNNSDDSTIKKNFINAAQAFEKCSRPTQAASCYK
ncbi:4782_t:CDS:2, partial [Funneliformis mosseae]